VTANASGVVSRQWLSWSAVSQSGTGELRQSSTRGAITCAMAMGQVGGSVDDGLESSKSNGGCAEQQTLEAKQPI
jgi:hypothetical protein